MKTLIAATLALLLFIGAGIVGLVETGIFDSTLNARAVSGNKHLFEVGQGNAPGDDLPFPRQRDTNAPQRGPERIVAGAIHGIEQPLALHRGLGVPELFAPDRRVVQSGEP